MDAMRITPFPSLEYQLRPGNSTASSAADSPLCSVLVCDELGSMLNPFDTREPMTAAPISAVLVATTMGPEVDDALRDWVTFFNGLGREYEILLASACGQMPEEAR